MNFISCTHARVIKTTRSPFYTKTGLCVFFIKIDCGYSLAVNKALLKSTHNQYLAKNKKEQNDTIFHLKYGSFTAISVAVYSRHRRILTLPFQ